MSIRRALSKQPDLASRKRGKEAGWWSGSYAIFVMTAIVLAVVLVIEVLRG